MRAFGTPGVSGGLLGPAILLLGSLLLPGAGAAAPPRTPDRAPVALDDRSVSPTEAPIGTPVAIRASSFLRRGCLPRMAGTFRSASSPRADSADDRSPALTLVVWEEEGPAGDPDVAGVVLDGDGGVVTPAGVAIATGIARQTNPRVFHLDASFLAVWEESSPEGRRLAAQRVSETGLLLGRPETVLRPTGTMSGLEFEAHENELVVRWLEPRLPSDSSSGWRPHSTVFPPRARRVAAGESPGSDAPPYRAGTTAPPVPEGYSPVSLVADINATGRESSYVLPIGVLGSSILLSADNGATGRELFISDGTPAGTSLVADICPGMCESQPVVIAVDGSVAWFSADDGEHGVELWRTDGTPAGTRLVRDICPGSCDGLGTFNWGGVALGGALLFSASDGVSDFEPWRSDGTELGTRRILDILPTGASYPFGWVRFGDRAVFSARDSAGRELWSTDGTAAGTVRVTDICPGPCDGSPFGAFVWSGLLYFRASEWTHGSELWVSDGTAAGTSLLADLCSGTCSSYPEELTPFDGRLFFAARDGALGTELWQTDGTPGGTTLVDDLAPGSASSAPSLLTAGAFALLFLATDPEVGDEVRFLRAGSSKWAVLRDFCPGPCDTWVDEIIPFGSGFLLDPQTVSEGVELWRSDGDPSSTELVLDACPGSCGSGVGGLLAAGGRAWYEANDGSTGGELWSSDGTSAGTALVADIRSSTGSSSPNILVDLGGTVVMYADDGIHGREPWRTDGTAAGTSLLADICPGPCGSETYDWGLLGNLLVFSADDGSHGREPWRTDGTIAGTFSLGDLEPGSGGSSPKRYLSAGGRLFFTSFSSSLGTELWVTDGTQAGTHLVTDLCPGTCSGLGLPLADWGDGVLAFSGNDGASGSELWRTDGTAGGTWRVADICPGSCSSTPSGAFLGMPSTIFFAASDSTHGYDLWTSDGTNPGTRLVKDLAPGTASSSPEGFVRVNGSVLFVANVSTYDRRLWKTDGTASGTSSLVGGDPRGLAAIGDRAYFVTGPSVIPPSVWTSDGTPGGTLSLATIPLASGTPSSAPDFVPVGTRVVFRAGEDYHEGLWATDGTPAGTVPLLASAPREGLLSGYPQLFAFPAAGLAIFSSVDAAAGREPWVSNGTPEGSFRLADLEPGPPGSSPGQFLVAGNDAFFKAFVYPTVGAEPWKLAAASFPLPADADGDGAANELDCQPLDPLAWGPIGEIRALALSKDGNAIRFAWLPPLSPGGSSARYDIHVSGVSEPFPPDSCQERDLRSTSAATLLATTGDQYFLILARNGCPSANAGNDSDGNPRVFSSCH